MTTAMNGDMDKIMRLGAIRALDVFVRAQYQHLGGKGRLAITGVVGPLKNGDARGSCGQIEMGLGDGSQIAPAPGWTGDSISRLLEIWRRWHMNDMRAGCEHQRAAWDTGAKLDIVTYKLTDKALVMQTDIQRQAMASLKATGSANVTPADQAILGLPYETHEAPNADGSGWYEVSKRESKLAGWVYQKNHPGGLLCKPCETCGYKYGSAWLHEDVPAKILAELAAFPGADRAPAWI